MINDIKGEVTVRTFDTIDINNCVPDNKYQVSENKVKNTIEPTWITNIMSALNNRGVVWNAEHLSPAFGQYNNDVHPIQRVCKNLDPNESFTHTLYTGGDQGEANLMYVMIGLENGNDEKALGLTVSGPVVGTVVGATYEMVVTNYFYGMSSPNFTKAEMGTLKTWNNEASSNDGEWTWWQKMASTTGLTINPAIYQSSSVAWKIILS